MRIEALAAFAAVVDAGTFTAAATALRRSQPAVSKLVAQLEEELGVELLDRSAYRPVLTERGRAFYEQAALVLEQTQALARFGATLAGRAESVVRLAVDAVAPLRPVVGVLRQVEAEHPQVRIELQTVGLGEALEALRDDEADLALGHCRDDDPKPSFAQLRRHRRVDIVAVVHREHPIAQAGSPTPLGLLTTHPQIVLRDSAADHRTLNVLPGGRHWSVTDVHAKKELILAGMGWGGLPQHVVAQALSSGELVALHVRQFETQSLLLHLARRRHTPHGPVAQRLWDAL